MGIKKLVRFDWAMKYILRNKANFDVLEAFLSNLLRLIFIISSIDKIMERCSSPL